MNLPPGCIDKKAAEIIKCLTCFSSELNIPKTVLDAAVLQKLHRVNLGSSVIEWVDNPGSSARSFFLHISLMTLLAICSLFPGRQKKKNFNIVLEAWGRNCGDFYKQLVDVLPNLSFAAFGKYTAELNANDRVEKFHQPKWLFSPEISRKLLRFGFFKWRLLRRDSNNIGCDLNTLFLLTCIEIAKHHTAVQNLNADILVSADDSGYPPLRSWVYKNLGIKKIFLIQNGARVELQSPSSHYITCDVFFGWSEHRLKEFSFFECEEVKSTGSVRLSEFLRQNGTETELVWDLMFIEQIHGANNLRHLSYMQLISNLAKYAIENPKIKIAYCPRLGRYNDDKKSRRQIDGILMASPIHIAGSEHEFSTYHNLLSAKFIMAFDSSIRLEALSLDKKVISFSFGAIQDDYFNKYCVDHFILKTTDYISFKEHLDFLLDKSNEHMIIETTEYCRKIIGIPVDGLAVARIVERLKSEINHGIV